LFYLCGVTLWGFFASTFAASANLFVSNEHIFSKVYFPRLISAGSALLSKLIVFAVQFIIFIGISMLTYRQVLQDRINVRVLLLPLLLLLIALFAVGLGLVVAASTVRYRDLQKLVGFGTQLLLYATPVIYPFAAVPASIARWLQWNPLTPIFETARWGFFSTEPVPPSQLAYGAIASAVVFVCGIASFNRVERNFVDEI